MIVGYGYWSPNLIRNIEKFQDFSIIGICEKDEARHDMIRKNHPSYKVYRHYTEAFKDPQVDAVVVGTVISSHERIARSALQHGKHVLVEKPLTTSVASSKSLIKIAKEKGLTLMVDHTFIFSGAITALKELIQKGEIGEVLSFDSLRLNLGLFQRDTNVLWDLAPHDFSLFHYVLPHKATHISAIGQKTHRHPIHTKHYESAVYITLYDGERVIGHIHDSWLAPQKIRTLSIVGDKGMVVYDQLATDGKLKKFNKTLKALDSSEKKGLYEYIQGETTVVAHAEREDLETMIGAFLKAVKTGHPPVTDGLFSLEVVKMLAAADRSLKSSGKKVKIQSIFNK